MKAPPSSAPATSVESTGLGVVPPPAWRGDGRGRCDSPGGSPSRVVAGSCPPLLMLACLRSARIGSDHGSLLGRIRIAECSSWRRTHPTMTSVSGAPAEPAVRVAGLGVDRGGRRVLDGLDFADPARSRDRSAGAERLGQDDAHARRSWACSASVAAPSRCSACRPGRSRCASRVGYVTQTPSVYLDLTVAANVRYFSAVLGVPAERAARALDAVDLADRRRRPGRAALRWGAVPRLARLRAARRSRADRARRAHRRARPGAAPRPLAAVPRARGRRCDAARVEPRDGRGGALRPAAAPARGATGGRRHAWRAAGAHGRRQPGGRVPAHRRAGGGVG